MPSFLDIFWNIFGIIVIGLGLRFYFRRLRLAIYTGGWASLAPHHTMLGEPMGLPWQRSSVRVGAITYKNTMNVAVQHGGLYLQRDSFALDKTILFLPAASLTLVSRHSASWLANAYCIFTVEGVDVWVEQPQADALLYSSRSRLRVEDMKFPG
ncbi:MAG: hypothetical protein EOO60_01570 [Hymenobacter sp.]|nr:MAG: hypothetical protein EOO60_01570 [Hymenobacter sp.]